MRLKIQPQVALIVALNVLLILFYVSGLPYASYFDDIVAAIFSIPFFGGLINKTYDKKDVKVAAFLLGIILIGLLSNLISGLVMKPSYWLNDGFSFLRMFMVYFGTLGLLNNKKTRAKRTVNILGKLSSLFIVVAFIFGVLNYLGIVNMYNSIRYGIKNYYFFFNNASQFGIAVGVAFAYIILSGKSSKWIEAISLLLLFMTAKGTSFIIIAVYLVLNFFVKRKIRWWHIVIGITVLVIVLQFQIQSYIFNENAPRALLLGYGFITALHYFPLGAGFATYGSNMAAVHYSPLYQKYGFAARRALTVFDINGTTTTYLNDNYLAMILGEFGFLGTILLIAIFLNVGKKVFSSQVENIKERHIVIAIFACLCGSSIMTGSIKNATGELIFCLLALFISCNRTERDQTCE